MNSNKQTLDSQKISNYQQSDMNRQEKQKIANKKTIKQIAFLGIFFLLLTLTYSSFSTIITFYYEQHEGFGYLGPLLLIANYGTFMICNIFAPFVKIHYKKQFIIGAICYSVNYALEIPQMLDAFGIFLLIFGSILGGVGAAIVWVSQGGFMSSLFQKYQIPHHYKGRYFGILNMLVFSNILLGSIVTTFGLGFIGDSQYFMILTGLGLLSIVFASFFLEDVQVKDKQYIVFKDQDQELKHNKQQDGSNQNNNGQSKGLIFRSDMKIMASIKQIFQFSKKMKYLLPMIVTDGAILGFISSSATHLLPQDHYTKVEAGIFLICMGCGAIIGGFFSGFFSDKFPILKVGKSTFLVFGVSMFLSLPLFMELIENFYYSYFLGFVWGFSWHYMDGWLWVSCSKIYQGKLQSFALNKFIHSLSFVIYQFAVILYGDQNSLQFIEYFFFVVLALMIVSLIFLIKLQNTSNTLRMSTQ